MERYAHEKMNAYKKGIILVRKIYSIMAQLPDEERYGLKSQMKRASISVVSNFVEGNSRSSVKERMRFFEYGYGSLLELDCQLIISQKLFGLDNNLVEELRDCIEELVRIFSGLKRVHK